MLSLFRTVLTLFAAAAAAAATAGVAAAAATPPLQRRGGKAETSVVATYLLFFPARVHAVNEYFCVALLPYCTAATKQTAGSSQHQSFTAFCGTVT